jgi:transcriptional regulator with XRE-family HTH domain
MTALQLVREDRGLSKAEAARLVRILPEAYSLIERGLLSPSLAQSCRIERAFGYPIGDLLAAVPHPAPLEFSE